MWSLVLTAFHALSSPASFQQVTSISSSQKLPTHFAHTHNSPLKLAETTQDSAPDDIIYALRYSLKYPAGWTKFTTQTADHSSDVFLARSFTNPSEKLLVTVTTTVRDFLITPRELPPNVKRFDVVGELYIGIIAQSGYKVYQAVELDINGRKGIRIVAETPDKKGSITVLVEGKDEKMVVSTAIYPLDTSVLSGELLDQVIAEVGLIHNSITIR